MKIEYKGKNVEEDRKRPEAWITYNEDNKKNQKKAYKIIMVLQRFGWNLVAEDGWIIVNICDKEDYKTLVEDYKKAKEYIAKKYV